jgi:O-antigen/teichoic acid export membrane protein
MYWQGLPIVPILLLAYLFLGVYYNFSVWFKLTDKTYYGTLITIGGVFVTLIGNYVLIPLYGYEGSSVAALLCYFSMAATCYWLGQKFYPIPYTIGKDMLYIVTTIIVVYIVNGIAISDQLAATFFHLVVIVCYLVCVVLIERKGFKAGQA